MKRYVVVSDPMTHDAYNSDFCLKKKQQKTSMGNHEEVALIT